MPSTGLAFVIRIRYDARLKLKLAQDRYMNK